MDTSGGSFIYTVNATTEPKRFYSCFVDGVRKHGLPNRVKGDKGAKMLVWQNLCLSILSGVLVEVASFVERAFIINASKGYGGMFSSVYNIVVSTVLLHGTAADSQCKQ